MKKHLLSLFMALCVTTSAVADSYNYLNIVSSSTIQSVALNAIKKITFDGVNIIVTAVDGTQTTSPLSTLSELTFTQQADAIRGITAAPAVLHLQCGRVVAAGSGMLLVYNAGGKVVLQRTISSTREEVSLDGLPHGLYIAKLGHTTLKIVR